MFAALRRWRQQQVLRSQAIPEALWRDSLESLLKNAKPPSNLSAIMKNHSRDSLVNVFSNSVRTAANDAGHTLSSLDMASR